VIYLSNRTRKAGLDTRSLTETLARLMVEIGEDDTSVSLVFVRDRAMREINRLHRGKDAPTDVLSFPLYPPEAFDRRGQTRPRGHAPGLERMLGDIVISVDAAKRQAAAYDVSPDREIERLLIHAVLHLAGHDHEAAGERTRMEREERRLARSIGMPWPYLERTAP
jgi:probable rRNA maturation factor